MDGRAKGIHSFLRVLTRKTFHPRRASNLAFFVSCAFFLFAVLCQFPPSTSMPIFSSGNPKSILYLSTASSGTGTNPRSVNSENSSRSNVLILAVLCLPLALLQRSSCERFLPVMIARLAAVIRSCSAYVRRLAVSSAASEIERLGMPYRSSQRCTVGRETRWILAMSCAELFPCQYVSDSHSRDGIGNLLSSPMAINVSQTEIKCNMNGTLSTVPVVEEADGA